MRCVHWLRESSATFQLAIQQRGQAENLPDIASCSSCPSWLDSGMGPTRGSKNRLANEKSPYLLQHAHNPVDWYPWSPEAFEKARRENKPIFLSIGYSTCHWCHVMAHESFESEDVAAIMNREFVNIKVDREERPDVDRVYMTFVQATTGHGGWPMSVWLTPELKPFVGGTYFPPEDRYGHSGFTKVLEGIATAWKRDHAKIAASGQKIVEALREAQTKETGSEEDLGEAVFNAGYAQLERIFDPVEGGFGNSPKFPHPVTLSFLLRFYARQRGVAQSDSDRALEMDLLTLRKMAAGGMHDHLGGGFHRYSVDRYWHVPHFEKMLYDQAQLAIAYLEAFQILQAGPHLNPLPEGEAEEKRYLKEHFASVARDTLDYVLRDMTSAGGGFFSAEDADSPVVDSVAAVYSSRRSDAQADDRRPEDSGAPRAPLQKTAEGAFYVWTQQEIDGVLGEASEIFNFHYGVEPHGNVPEGSDPHGELREKNVLIERHAIAETAQRFQRSEGEIQKSLAQSRAVLFELRAKRPRPHLDDKILASWNGLMISAFARAAQVLDEPRYLEAATRGARFLRTELYEEKSKVLYRSYREGRSDIQGFADDYAFVIQALLDLYEASFDIDWLKFAIELQETMDRLFFDQENGGYFSTSGTDASVFLRMKDDNDSAEPAPSSVAALNLLRLAQIRNEPSYQERARKTIAAFSPTLSRFATAMPQMLVALDFSLSKPRQIVIVGKPDTGETKALVAEVHRHFLPNRVLLLGDSGDGQKFLGQTNEAIRAMSPANGKAAAYVCENFTCKAPVTDPKQLADLLSQK
jgi:uncharacterized protein YyaL (SSP411 family)